MSVRKDLVRCRCGAWLHQAHSCKDRGPRVEPKPEADPIPAALDDTTLLIPPPLDPEAPWSSFPASFTTDPLRETLDQLPDDPDSEPEQP